MIENNEREQKIMLEMKKLDLFRIMGILRFLDEKIQNIMLFYQTKVFIMIGWSNIYLFIFLFTIQL